MKKQSFLALTLLVGFGSSQLNGSEGSSSSYAGYMTLAKAIGQLSGFVYLSKKYVELDEKKDMTRSCRYQHGFEKWWFLLGGGLLAASITENWKDNIIRVGLLAGLVGATHAIANNEKVIKSVRRMPFTGGLFTDPEDSNGFEQTSIGAITRYACTYMSLHTMLKWLTANTDYDASNFLL